ncbi:hypothetical protein DACRYDRAFT_103110 [Dacryopinax primogenitus]|uniref:Uncharacterized protein n=1 Tax=Dacryopinax primogenitus (strain DJM 731) TaxID=1858805 RepID=M5GGV8_DACPD|nr:uncharacterized protein DACRYDRAFT_103110 [Dacryopinax primogenitus]EJU06163.1 hypothetical protein DACRYDRAFT_103110 [Dacryopinax primogenitus]
MPRLRSTLIYKEEQHASSYRTAGYQALRRTFLCFAARTSQIHLRAKKRQFTRPYKAYILALLLVFSVNDGHDNPNPPTQLPITMRLINVLLLLALAGSAPVLAQIHCEACCICDPICRNPCESEAPNCCGPEGAPGVSEL